jgi:polysaccharide pyruvyl transferase WcaK-like protein
MKIAHFGTFDVDNYGDLLFPHIVEWRMPSIEWIHISPSSNVPKFSDALKSYTPNMLSDIDYDGVIIGGGNIFHLRDCPIKEYFNIENSAIPSIIAGAASLASKKRVPFVINGPSIRKFAYGYLEKALIKRILSYSSYSSFRDQFSFESSLKIKPEVTSLIPDTAFDISRLWPKNSLNEKIGQSKNYIVIHVNKRYGGNVVDTAKSIDIIVSNYDNAEIRFLPIGPCHGDIEYMQAVAKKIKSRYQLISELSLREFASQISNSKAYFGSSMHGFITALSYGVPSLLVVNTRPLDKFIGLLSMVESPKYVMCPSWNVASEFSTSAWVMPYNIKNKIFDKLDSHWDRVVNIFDTMSRSSKLSMDGVLLNNWRFLTLISQAEVNFRNKYIDSR